MTFPERIGLLGFGEVGQILGADIPFEHGSLAAYDLQFGTQSGAPLEAAATDRHVIVCRDASSLGGTCDLIISAVTGEQALFAAQSVAHNIQADTWYVDVNSAAPSTKRQAAELINGTGGRYVEASIMSPAPPKRLAAPILLGGPFAERFLPVGQMIGLTNMTFFSDTYGQASAAKMCRSVMIKGIEALLSEALITARSYGVEKTVLASLSDLFPGPDWPTLARYMIGRTLERGGRRAEEMREVAKTVADTGLTPDMSLGTVTRQDWAKTFSDLQSIEPLEDILDALGAAVRDSKKGTAA